MTYVKKKNKKRIWILSILTMVMLVILGGGMLFGQQDGYRTVKVFEVSGRVGVVHNGIEYEAYPGMILTEGYTIVTSTDSYVRLVLDGDKYIKLEEGSKAVFEQLGTLGTGKTTINLERGVILSEIVRSLKADENYIINTPNAVLAVRGTFFKVDVSVNKLGDMNTNVFTYGGAVSSNRIEPNGNIIEEDVFIHSGYKTTVKMDNIETIYVLEPVESEYENTVPIRITDVSDEDIIDIYFASENGHEMFLTPEEIEEELQIREINISEYSSVYDKAENNNKNSVTSIDDGEYVANVDKPENGNGMVSDGGHRHIREEDVIEATCIDEGMITVICSDCGELIAERVLKPLGHAEDEPIVIKEATCTEKGMQEIYCKRCDIKMAVEDIPLADHYEVDGGVEDCHSQCENCVAVVSTTHDYEDDVTQEPTCEDVGEVIHTCSCGYSYTETLAKLNHNAVTTTIVAPTCTQEGKVRTSCEYCGKVFSEGSKPATGHSYTATVINQATCTSDGRTKYTCSCGDSYIATTTNGTHAKANANASQTTCAHCGTKLIEFNSSNFPNAEFRNLLKADGIDVNNDGMLESSELNAVTMIRYHYAGITDVTGLEHFTELTYLELIGNPISSAPVENLTKLELLNLSYTKLNSINVTRMTNLENLQLAGTYINSLDLSRNTKLEQLSLANCSNIGSLDLSNNKLLVHIQLQETAISDFQIDGFTQLQEVWLTEADIQKVRITNSPSLIKLVCPDELEVLDVTGCSSLVSVDISEVKDSLTSVTVDGSGLQGTLDLSNCTNLQSLSANNCNNLVGINISDCTSLVYLEVRNGSAVYVDADGCYSLNNVLVEENKYVVPTGTGTVDYSSVTGFEANKVNVISGGTFTNGVFQFDAGNTVIVYNYLLYDNFYGQFIIAIE